MICAPAGTLTLIFDWLGKTFSQISGAEGVVTRFEAAEGLVGEAMSPTQIATILEAEVAQVRSLLEA
ncbi:hypothetical protein [Bradyrhizobium elkanii]|uniref:hypothetical protein n=1 Tax=Bradyrhizobium elkanii TaxID=29448 RepID=UPI001BAA2E63|nr:hypothetical protein [Bradyrhizobium elkanii]MBR1159458.1 hypothetical protein [Bradyrhizobium elkanii]